MAMAQERRWAWNDLQWIRAEISRLRSPGRPLTDRELEWRQTLLDREEELEGERRARAGLT